jgi:thioredoxin-dependent peroxiredoxin
MSAADHSRHTARSVLAALTTARYEKILTVASVALAALAIATFLLSLPGAAWGKPDAPASPVAGETAPDVTLVDQDGETTALSALWAERPLVVYFYPKDFTPGCTAQACSLRDANREMRASGLHVVGISFDSVETHRKFADKHGLPFTLLADPDGEAARAYGVAGSFLGMDLARRVTFLIGTDGKVAQVWDPAGTTRHAEQVLEGARELGLVAER